MLDTQKAYFEYNNQVSADSKAALDETAKFVQNRYWRMYIHKYEWHQRVNGIRSLYDAHQYWLINGPDWEEPVRFPTLRDVISSLTDRYMENPPESLLYCPDKNRKSGALGLKTYIDERKDSLYEKRVRRQVVEDMFFYGKGLRGVMFHKLEKEYEDDNKKLDKKTLFDDICTYRIDPRNAFIDENCYYLQDSLRINGARDFVHKRMIPYTTFKQMFGNNPRYKNVDTVVPVNFFSEPLGGTQILASQRETNEKSPVWVVKLYEYYNQEENWYVIVANNTTIYEDTLLKAKGTTKIPVAEYNFEPRHDSVWGTTIGEILAPHIYLEDTLINLEIMNLKLSLQPVMAISGEFGYNPRVHVLQPGGVWTAGGRMNGKIQDNIAPIISGNPNTNFYNFYNILQSKFTISSRADLRSLETYQEKTATEVAAQSRAYNAHNERIESINEIEAEGILSELMIEVTKSFINAKNEKGEYRRIPIKNYIVNQSGGALPVFLESSGAEDYFDLTEDIISTDVDVKVVDRRSQIANNSEKLGRLMQAIPLMSNLSMANPELAKKIDWISIIEELLTALSLDVKKVMKEDLEDYMDEYELIKEEIMLGHNVDVPSDETRKESQKRLKFLYELRVKDGKETKDWQEYSREAKSAWQYHVDQTMANIFANQIEKQAMKEQGEQQMVGAQTGIAQIQGQPMQEPTSIPGQSKQTNPVIVPTPDKGLMSTQLSPNTQTF